MKKGNPISASTIKTYLLCEFKHFIEKVLGIRRPQTLATMTGTIVHSVLERYMKGHKKHWQKELFWEFKKNKPWELSKHFLVHEYQCAGCLFLDNIQHYHGDFYKDFPRVPVTKLLYKDCPFFTLLDSRDLIQKVIEREDSPLNYRVIDTEKEFLLDIGEGVSITGFIDLVLEIDSDTIEIRDWKTGSWVPTYQEAIVDPQLRLYDLAVSILYPQYKTRILTFDYIKQREMTFVISDEEREQNRQWIISIAKEIEANQDPNRKITFKCKSFCDLELCNKIYPEKLITIGKLKEEGKW